MRLRTPIGLLYASLFLCPLSAVAQTKAETEISPISVGAIADRYVISYAGDRLDVTWYLADLRERSTKQLKAVLPDEAGRLRLLYLASGGMTRSNVPTRWRLLKGYFWATRVGGFGTSFATQALLRMPLPLAPSADENGSAPRDQDQMKKAASGSSGSEDKTADGRLSETIGPMLPLSGVVPHNVSRLRPFYISEIREGSPSGIGPYHDVIPLSPQSVLLLVLCKGRLTLWKYDYWLDSDETTGHGVWERKAALDAPFIDAFHVALVHGTYFFVTDDGAVFAVADEGGEWKSRQAWEDPSRPIIAMLVGSDGERAFAFGKDFYLKLGRDREPKTCRDVTQGPEDLGNPMRIVYECGLALYEMGELQTPDDKR